MNKPLISIITLCYNHAEFLEESIISIWEQDYPNIEIIVIDDGSQDGSGEKLLELQKQSSFPMDIILQKNTGNIGLNLNRGIKKAKGEFISFLSCDDKLAPNIFFKLFAAINKDTNIQFVIPKEYFLFGSRNNDIFDAVLQNSFTKTFDNSIDKMLELEKEGGSFFVQGTLLRKSIIDAVRGFDEDMLGDDIVLRVKMLQHIKKNPPMKFDVIEGYTFCYRMHENNIHLKGERQCKILYQVMMRYFPGQQSKELQKWVEHIWKQYVKKGEFKKALNLFFSNMNSKKFLHFRKIIFHSIKYYIRKILS
jgi:glycosyltransferase involved in cell wall biosynthesis